MRWRWRRASSPRRSVGRSLLRACSTKRSRAPHAGTRRQVARRHATVEQHAAFVGRGDRAVQPAGRERQHATVAGRLAVLAAHAAIEHRPHRPQCRASVTAEHRIGQVERRRLEAAGRPGPRRSSTSGFFERTQHGPELVTQAAPGTPTTVRTGTCRPARQQPGSLRQQRHTEPAGAPHDPLAQLPFERAARTVERQVVEIAELELGAAAGELLDERGAHLLAFAGVGSPPSTRPLPGMNFAACAATVGPCRRHHFTPRRTTTNDRRANRPPPRSSCSSGQATSPSAPSSPPVGASPSSSPSSSLSASPPPPSRTSTASTARSSASFGTAASAGSTRPGTGRCRR